MFWKFQVNLKILDFGAHMAHLGAGGRDPDPEFLVSLSRIVQYMIEFNSAKIYAFSKICTIVSPYHYTINGLLFKGMLAKNSIITLFTLLLHCSA